MASSAHFPAMTGKEQEGSGGAFGGQNSNYFNQQFFKANSSDPLPQIPFEPQMEEMFTNDFDLVSQELRIMDISFHFLLEQFQ